MIVTGLAVVAVIRFGKLFYWMAYCNIDCLSTDNAPDKTLASGYLLQSSDCNQKISFTLTLKTEAIFSANNVEGMYLPISIELIVCRETLTLAANSACVMFNFARSTFKLFFIVNL